jgi:hypothetical protein
MVVRQVFSTFSFYMVLNSATLNDHHMYFVSYMALITPMKIGTFYICHQLYVVDA